MTEQKPEYKVPGNLVHVFDEATTGAEQLAEIVGVYYQTLITAKVPKNLASELTLDYQAALLGNVFGYKNGDG